MVVSSSSALCTLLFFMALAWTVVVSVVFCAFVWLFLHCCLEIWPGLRLDLLDNIQSDLRPIAGR